MEEQTTRRRRRSDESVLATLGELRDGLRRSSRARAPRDDARIKELGRLMAPHLSKEGPLLPILHAVQDAFGHVPADLVPEIAEALNLSRAEVHGVVTYYHHFRSAPAGRQVLELCRAEACQAMGGEALWQHACDSLSLPREGGTTPDGALTLQPVYCLGLCAQSPAVLLDGQPHARLDAARLDALLGQREEAAA